MELGIPSVALFEKCSVFINHSFCLQVEFAGDNFIRISGDTVNHAKSQMFSWEAGAKGLDVHALAEPTKLEALKKEYEAKKTDFKSDAKQGRICFVTHSVDQIFG